jgi:hypothetical protein
MVLVSSIQVVTNYLLPSFLLALSCSFIHTSRHCVAVIPPQFSDSSTHFCSVSAQRRRGTTVVLLALGSLDLFLLSLVTF